MIHVIKISKKIQKRKINLTILKNSLKLKFLRKIKKKVKKIKTTSSVPINDKLSILKEIKFPRHAVLMQVTRIIITNNSWSQSPSGI